MHAIRRRPRLLVALTVGLVLAGTFAITGATSASESFAARQATPGFAHYVVVSGDTWSGIARKHCAHCTTAQINTLAGRISVANRLTTTSTLAAGNVLHVNLADVPPVTVPTTTTTTTVAPTTPTTVAPTTTTTRPPTTPPTTVAPTTTTRPPTTTTTAPPGGRFATLPVNAALPSEATCASRVRPMSENRSENGLFNNTRGNSAHNETPRVTGNYVGTTDMIIQWSACKWGLDEDWARAQAGIESWHRQNDTFGDFGSDPAACLPGHPIGFDGRPGECPQSVGLLQVRYPYHLSAFENNNSILSTSYNADYAWSVWRSCFNGELTWLNTVERGQDYVAGDALGCMGVWFAGRWYTPAALGYMNRVRDEFFSPRVWAQAGFPPAVPTGTPPPTTTTVVATTTTVAATTTTGATTTTAAPVTTTSQATTTSAGVPSGDFMESFTSAPGFYSRFRLHVHFRDPGNVERDKTWHGDHNAACQGPTTDRTVHASVESEFFWWCAPAGPDSGHIMTSMGDIDGYTILSFSPNRAFTNFNRVCWDINLTNLGGRKWTQVVVVPRAAFEATGSRLDYISPVTQDVDQTALHFPAGSFAFQNWDQAFRLYQGETELLDDGNRFSTTDRARRYHHCIVDNNNGTVTVSQERDTTTYTRTVNGSLPNDAVVIFQDDNYTPDKDGEAVHKTWHWDNIEIS